ncbi:MAG: helix-turn-helix domain-containing protein, partial [Bacteroidota bacterium]|nr:helix-turn-helix domain-containing protein [Bacteroidota bacterium]
MAASVPVVAAASIDQRFAQLIQQFGLTKNSFAISLGKTASVVQHLIDGRNKPGFDLMCKVFEVYPNVSRDWLLLGRGPMLVGSNGLNGPAVAAAQPAAPAPDFEPIDLADVAPRAARRPTVS